MGSIHHENEALPTCFQGEGRGGEGRGGEVIGWASKRFGEP